MALAATAIVHPANNIFKVALVGRKADLGIVLKFALPVVSVAKLGALLLNYMAAGSAHRSLRSWRASMQHNRNEAGYCLSYYGVCHF